MGYLGEVILLACLVAIALAVREEMIEAMDRQKQAQKAQDKARFLKLAELRMKGGKR